MLSMTGAAAVAGSVGYALYQRESEEAGGPVAEVEGGYAGMPFVNISLADNGEKTQQRVYGDKPFPLVLTLEGCTSVEEAESVLGENKEALMELLGTHGAILFRGLPLKDEHDFARFLNPFEFEYGDYIGGGGPRTSVLGPIHNSTFTPAHRVIPFHHVRPKRCG